MSPELLFWYELALKMVMTATIVVVASVAVERSGPFIGGLIAALPSAIALNASVYAITLPASARYRGGAVPREKMKRTRYDIPLRALTAAVVVAVVTTASHR